MAFPEHTIKFDISREQAAEKAKEFVTEHGNNPANFKETTIFTIDDQSKTYLEREVGVTETAELASNEVDVWHFTTRFFKPLEKEEITVTYLPNGRLSGYFHEIEENAKGARLSKALAQERAETFLKQTIKADLSDWKLVSNETNERKARTDHTFTWEKKTLKVKDATYRMEVQINGDKIGGYFEYLKVPEAWLRAYEKETSNNDLAQAVAESLMFLIFGLAIVITFIRAYRQNNLQFLAPRRLGVATALIAILTALNSIPLALAAYPTTISWEAFIGSVVLLSIVGGIVEGSFVMFIIAAGEVQFRQMFPHKSTLASMIGTGLRTKSVNQALFVGVFAGIIFFAYELVYYFFGKNVGFWAPANINYADIHSTVLPWLYPLFIGFIAAASEEGIFRLFGIPFLKKYLKSTWVAIFITAVIWGFLHSNYPQSPWFVRGIEISIIGVVLGWMFVRFGFIASFTAHFTFNALQTAISFYEAGSLYASISSTVISLLPLIIALIFLASAYAKKGFAPELHEDKNENFKAEKLKVQKEKSKIIDDAYQPLTNKRKVGLIGLTVISLMGLWYLYPKTSLDQVPTSLNRTEVKNAANEALAKKNINIRDYESVVTFSPNNISLEEKYILEEGDFQTLKKFYPEKLPLAFWSVRYFKPLQKEEFIVDVLPDGKVYQIIHVLDEKAPGANLTAAQATKLAENYLVREKQYNLAEQNQVENKVDKKERRTDHVLVYEENKDAVGEATMRTEVTIKGNEVSGYNTYLKLPEAWIREQEETSTQDFAILGILIFSAVLLFSLGFKTFLDLVKDKRINFRLAYKISAVATVFSLFATINSLSTFYANYNSTVPLTTYTLQSLLSVILGFVMSFLIFAIIIGLFLALWRQYLGNIIPVKTKERLHYFQDAIISGYSIPLIFTGISSGIAYFLIMFDLLDSVATFDTFPRLDDIFPAISTISELPMAVGGIAFIAIALLLLKKYFKTWKRILVCFLIIALLLAVYQQKTLEDFFITILQNILILTGGVLLVTYILRKNMLAYIFMLYSSLFLSSGWVLFLQPNLFFKVNGIVLLLFAFIPIIVYVWYRDQQSKRFPT